MLCLLTGVAGSGKTHTKHLLFGKNPPEVRASREASLTIIVCKTGEQFQEVNINVLDKVLATEIASGINLEKRTFLLVLLVLELNQVEGERVQELVHNLPAINPLSNPTPYIPQYGASPDNIVQQLT